MELDRENFEEFSVEDFSRVIELQPLVERRFDPRRQQN
jgi:hypothetical protein